MNRTEFLNGLNNQLSRIPQADRDEILYDYEEHFSIGLEHGKTEEEIAKDLGDPKAIARQFAADTIVKQAAQTKSAGSITRAVFAIAGLGFFNLIFILGPFMALVSLLIAFFATAIAISISGIAAVLIAFAAPMFPDIINLGGINSGVIVFTGIGLSSLGALFFLGVIYLSKGFFKGTLCYLKMNMKIINK